MQLVYFAIPGRAEATRIMLRLAKLPFEDLRISGETFRCEWKPKSPTGSLPVLILDDGYMLVQSAATSWYAAEQAGMVPSEPLDKAKTLQIIGCLDDANSALTQTMAIADPSEKAAARQKSTAPGGAMHAKLSIIEKMIAGAATPFFCGDKMTMVDVYVFVYACNLSSGQFDVGPEVIAQFPAIKAMRDKVAAEAEVAAMYAHGTGVYEFFK